MTPLDSLARGYSIAVTARRHHLTEAAVRAVADAHGWPDQYRIECAARAAHGLPPLPRDMRQRPMTGYLPPDEAIDALDKLIAAGWTRRQIGIAIGVPDRHINRVYREHARIHQDAHDAILALHRSGQQPPPPVSRAGVDATEARRVVQQLHAAGLSWPAIGRMVGRHRTTVSMIARGVSPTISAELAAAILALEEVTA